VADHGHGGPDRGIQPVADPRPAGLGLGDLHPCPPLTGKFWPALFAGFVFGFCAYEITHEASGQTNLTVTLLIPLIAYLVLRWWDGSLGRRGFLIWMALALAAEFYTFLEAFADLTLIAPIALVIGYVVAAGTRGPRWSGWPWTA